MNQQAIAIIQRRLLENGCDPGPLDGIWGRKTVAAVKAFQQQKGLRIHGLIDGPTQQALTDNQAVPSSASTTVEAESIVPWFAEAKRLLATREISGPGSNPTILAWAQDLELNYTSDDIPWCGLFTAHCMASTMVDEAMPNNPLAARKWASFGVTSEPRLGAVMVFWRESKIGFKGHVGFYAGENDKAYLILGGNQSNQVSFAWISKERLLAARWPTSGQSILSKPRQINEAAILSINEA